MLGHEEDRTKTAPLQTYAEGGAADHCSAAHRRNPLSLTLRSYWTPATSVEPATSM